MIRVLVVDDHHLFAEGLATLIQRSEAIAVATICTDASQVLAALADHGPDLVLLDINLGETDGVTLCRTMLYHYPSLNIIAVTMHHELRFVRAMREAGAKGYLLKNTDYRQVMEAIHTVHQGGTFFSDQLEKEARYQPPSSNILANLNPKEKRILDGVMAGKTSRQIAEGLNASLKTIEFYRNSLFVKFDVKNVVELVNKARHHV